MTIRNQQPCQVDGVVVPLGEYVYSMSGNGMPIYWCYTHWMQLAFDHINNQLVSAGWADMIVRSLVYDDTVM